MSETIKGPTGTTIKHIRNDSGRTVSFIRSGARTEEVGPNSSKSTELLLPGGDTNGYMVYTTTNCRIWDNDWKIHGKYEGEGGTVTFLEGGGNGVGGSINVVIGSNGRLSMSKA